VNFVVFQAVWFVCVHGAANGSPWIGPAAAALLLPINLIFCPRPGAELRLWTVAGLLGLALDTALRSSGWIGFPAATNPGVDPALGIAGFSLQLAPLWIVTLWVAFGSLLNSSLTWLSGRPLLTVLMSAIGGPFSFWSGTRMGATAVPGGSMGYVALAIEYAVAVPILMQAGRSLTGAVHRHGEPAHVDTPIAAPPHGQSLEGGNERQ
jgi:hypothetical protein